MTDIIVQELRDAFFYDRDSGVIRWKVKSGSSSPGKAAGSLNNTCGYLYVSYLRKKYAVHRLAWALEHGEFPSGQVDHINRNRLDNRISNLRVVTSSENMKNCGMSKTNTSGIKGVRFHMGKWEAYQSVNDRTVYLGRHDTQDRAAEAVNNFRAANGFMTDVYGGVY